MVELLKDFFIEAEIVFRSLWPVELCRSQFVWKSIYSRACEPPKMWIRSPKEVAVHPKIESSETVLLLGTKNASGKKHQHLTALEHCNLQLIQAHRSQRAFVTIFSLEGELCSWCRGGRHEGLHIIGTFSDARLWSTFLEGWDGRNEEKCQSGMIWYGAMVMILL